MWGYEIYRTSFGHVHLGGGTVELLSDSQPYLVGTVSGHGNTAFADTSRDALVGPRRHVYQVRALYAPLDDYVSDHDSGGRLSADAHVFREHDAAQPGERSPRNLTVSIPTKEAVATGTPLGIELAWDAPTHASVLVTGYVIQRCLVT